NFETLSCHQGGEPGRRGDPAMRTARRMEIPQSHAPPPRPTILIADDESSIRLLVRETLGADEYRILEVADGTSALQAARTESPNLLVLDVSMPQVDGVEVCRQLRTDPTTRALPIIILSAKGQETDRQRGLDAGANAYLSKPFSPLQLLRLVEQ